MTITPEECRASGVCPASSSHPCASGEHRHYCNLAKRELDRKAENPNARTPYRDLIAEKSGGVAPEPVLISRKPVPDGSDIVPLPPSGSLIRERLEIIHECDYRGPVVIPRCGCQGEYRLCGLGKGYHTPGQVGFSDCLKCIKADASPIRLGIL